jgi:hypothetical protein
VLPRAHDCVTVLLGSRERYTREHAAAPATYWYSEDLLGRGDWDDDFVVGLQEPAPGHELRRRYRLGSRVIVSYGIYLTSRA